MGVESKIRELLEGKLQDDTVAVIDEQIAGDQQPPMQGGSSKANLPTSSGDAHRPLDKKQGDASHPLQGSSNANPEMQDLSGTGNPEGGLTSEVGKAASAKAGNAPRPQHSGAGSAPNYSDGAATQSVVNQKSSEGNRGPIGEDEEIETEEDQEVLDSEVEEMEDQEVVAEDEEVEYVNEGEEEEEELVEEEELDEDELEAQTLFEDDIANLFKDEEHLSEEFKTQAASLFEATVVARVNQQVEIIENELVEEASKAFDEAKEKLVENVDKYLSYVTEQWLKENELAVVDGLRNEINESFIEGMKQVFTEHYIEMPEEKYDVLTEQQNQIDALKSKLDEEISKSVSISEEREQLQKERVFRSVVDDLAETEVEKFATLIEDVSYDNEEMYTSKLNVIKENYFPKAKSDDTDKLGDSVDQGTLTDNSVMSKYVQGISQAAKFDRVKN
tara:strand:- start:765 stop:2102 length:1338 start_codon:yes stop_codon:yes gene_type:complete